MQTTLKETPTIKTTVLKRLETLVNEVADSAEMAIVKGPAGIGKTFAIKHIAETFQHVDVFTATARTEIAGRINGIAAEILNPYGVYNFKISDSMELVWNLVARRPFTAFPSKSVLIIDEAQALQVQVLEALRGLYDRGDDARNYGGNYAAVGILFVGNDTFLSRSGGPKKADYEPFTTRGLQVSLGRPTETDLRDYVEQLPYLDDEMRDELVRYGLQTGSIRPIAKVWRRTTRMHHGSSLTNDQLKTMIKLVGGV